MAKEIDWGQYFHPDASTTLWQQMGLVLRLSVPAILAEISGIAMQYIDAAMVGSLGANATAAIGLVASTTWLFGGLCIAMVTGFSVQIAHLIGGGRRAEAQSVVRQGLMAALLWGKLPISAFVVAVNAGDQIQRKHQVFFAYPDGTPGLQGIDLAIRKGSKVAIVGRNGSGKSTLIKLLLRFYDASSGSIRQNGRDIREFAVSSYRAQFGAVFQDFNIYAASVRDNVCMGEEAEEGRLVRALGRAGWYGGVKEFGGGCCRDGGKEYGEGCGRAYGEGGVPELELQLTRELDEEGVLFSGGQLQRLALARAFYKDSDIVIMDEPTAAMDVFFEREFYRTVFRQLKDKTVIFVSHRLSSVTACDTIVYMERGRILEQGTHDYLMGLQGGYYRLFRAQFE